MFTIQCFGLSLLLPDTITTIDTVLHANSKLAKLVSKDGVQAIHPANFFPAINRILSLIRDKTSPVPTEMHLRRAGGGSHLDNTPIAFHSYVTCGGKLDGHLEKACNTT